MGSCLRLKSMTECSKVVICCIILHNLCIRFGNQWFEEEIEDSEEDLGHAPPEDTDGNQREKRRNEILSFFAQKQNQDVAQ